MSSPFAAAFYLQKEELYQFLVKISKPKSRSRARSGEGDAGSRGDLESSLIQIYHHHHHNSLKLQDQAELIGTEKAKKDAIKKAGRVSDLLVEVVNGGMQESFINEKRIEAEIRLWLLQLLVA
ncbi:hypothetical protein J1N35_023269 [Gossypium stocksii]|uniref:Biogenesis of lysosome-related organelles complex 1 subunit 1 n=1 Tax=Gossypium stocksii TaxID=47602 RepID=A0A9D3VIH1_9ROSI|nr:hypothetical protein J1N35_023269 [Gossypium stocksii]